MSLFLGTEKVNVVINGKIFKVHIPTVQPGVGSIRLMSFDDYLLQDADGLYITVKEI